MRKRFWIVVGCMVTLFSSPGLPTTIVVLSRNGSIYLGADSMRAPEPGTRPGSAETTCKIRKYGTVFVAHYGTVLLGIQPKGAHISVKLDSDRIERDAMSASIVMSLSGKADLLQKAMWDAYKSVVYDIPSQKAAYQPGFKAALGDMGFVLAGLGRDSHPEAIVLRFNADFTHAVPVPRETRISVPLDRTGIILGMTADYPLNIKNTDVEGKILGYLTASAHVHPSAVGPPFTIARVASDGQITYDQAGACRY